MRCRASEERSPILEAIHAYVIGAATVWSQPNKGAVTTFITIAVMLPAAKCVHKAHRRRAGSEVWLGGCHETTLRRLSLAVNAFCMGIAHQFHKILRKRFAPHPLSLGP